MAAKKEEKGWEEAAAVFKNEDGKGIPLVAIDPDKDDMTPVYRALKVSNVFATKRLDEYICRLQKEQRRPNQISLEAIGVERIAELADFVEAEMDDRTKNKAMSEASVEWAESILASYRIKHKTSTTANADVGSLDDPLQYEWNIQTKTGKVWSESKHRGTTGALQWLKDQVLDTNGPYKLKIVSGVSLPKVKGNQKSTTGKANIAIGTKSDINFGNVFTFVKGPVELKTNKYPLKTGQNLLELLALSRASSFQKAVVLLATNCNKKWEVFYFASGTEIRCQICKHGSKAWEDFI